MDNTITKALVEKQDEMIKELFSKNGIDILGMTEHTELWFFKLRAAGWDLKLERVDTGKPPEGYITHTTSAYILLKNDIEVDRVFLTIRGKI